MAKKFVRGVTGVEDINSFDKTLTNVNDVVSDGQDTYIHTKKGKTESYYKLTDSVKQVESSDGLLTISKHDGTVSVANTGLATKEELATKQNKLSVGDGLSLENNRIIFKPTYAISADISDGIYKSYVTSDGELSVIFSFNTSSSKYVQFAFRESTVTSGKMIGKFRFVTDNVPSQWFNILMDEITITNLINAKQNTLTNNSSIGVVGTGLRQLYALKQTYTVTGGVLKTHVKSLSENTNLNTSEEEFNFIVKLNKGVSSVNFTLNAHDTTKFGNIMSAYGDNNTVRISGCVFTLSGSTLTVSTANNTDQNYVITFSDII